MSTVGFGAEAVASASGNQWNRIVVPSNEVRSWSLVEPATGVAVTGCDASGTEHRPAAAVEELATEVVDFDVDVVDVSEQAAASTATTTSTRTVTRLVSRLVRRDRLNARAPQ
jgi:hypothetical protein